MNTAHPLAPSARLVGTVVNRKEDPRLLGGAGRYVDDVVVPGMVHAHFVRSDIARGRISRIDTSAAQAATGVVAVLTATDLNPLQRGPMRATPMLGMPGEAPERPLAERDVKFVGDPVVLVVAESRALAEDAAELVEIDIEPLPPIVDFELATDAPDLVHAGERDTNVFSRMEIPGGDGFEAIFETAAHVIDQTFRQQRYLAVPMETRGIVAWWSPPGHEFRVWVSTQSPHDVRAITSRITGVSEQDVRVTMGDVGGGFGQKAYLARDEQVIILAGFRLGLPVKWIEDRRENLIAATSSRNERVRVRLAADAEGTILAASFDQLDDAGAYPLSGSPGMMAAMMFPGPYRIARYACSAQSAFTNTCPRAPYRGPWQVETFAREQAMDLLARDVGVDPLELRRRNVVHRHELPYTMASGMPLVEISPEETLAQATEMAEYAAFREEQQQARAAGRLIGVGISLYIEPQTPMSVYGAEPCHIRVEPNGTVDVYLGSGSHGQGLETTTAQLVAEHLGVDFDEVAVHQGDTAETPYAFGTGGSRSGPVLGAAIRQASLQLRDKVAELAAHRLEAAAEDIEIIDSVASVRGTPAQAITMSELARSAYWDLADLPPGMEPGLEVISRYRAPDLMYSNACHVCMVEIDRVTGAVKILRYIVSEDCGVMINPAVVNGQIDGGAVQGIGGALLEEFVYDEAGNPLTTTFLDYLLPTASDVPAIEHGHIETPGTTAGNYKGVGEGGAIGAPPAVANAVNDALAHVGAAVFAHPLSPPRIRAALDEVGAGS
ncbi:MAG TPA: xanthine dehydrogenase family protein molybdopterin-binding subunit [Acidimicrobiia bacterium]|jgi:carbon-monoxide dehydrogenase large subunit|nr:xanthine dehydrogenase family protein molybdopterin-binding subunit [Acidimicrobiia bacterium]